MPIRRVAKDPPLKATINTGNVVYMYTAMRAATDLSPNGIQQLKGYFSNNND
jgi:hypothetical protein